MFQRYTEKARRIIFFARYEAIAFGASSIDTHHLLLGILREYPVFVRGVSAESLRTEIEREFPKGAQTPTSEDMPLSHPAKRVLEVATEQADELGHFSIEGGHLLLAMVLLESGFVGGLLRKNGIDEEFVKSKMPPEVGTVQAAASFLAAVAQLTALGRSAGDHLMNFTEADARRAIGRNGWSRKQALGHLIDWATAHHQWFARALVEPKLDLPGYPGNESVVAQNYQGTPWSHLVETWLSMNSLLARVLSAAPEERAGVLCRVGVEEPVPFSKLAANYVAHCEDLLGAILKRA